MSILFRSDYPFHQYLALWTAIFHVVKDSFFRALLVTPYSTTPAPVLITRSLHLLPLCFPGRTWCAYWRSISYNTKMKHILLSAIATALGLNGFSTASWHTEKDHADSSAWGGHWNKVNCVRLLFLGLILVFFFFFFPFFLFLPLVSQRIHLLRKISDHLTRMQSARLYRKC